MKPVHLTLSFLGHLVFLVLLGTASTLLKQAPPPPPDTIRISFGELPRAAGGRKREARGTKTIPAPREEPKPKPATPPKETPKPKATLPAPKEQPKPPAAKPAEAVKPVTKAQAEKTPPTAVPKPAPGLAGATGAAASGAKEGAAVPAPGAAEEGPGAQAVGAGASVQARGDLGAGDSYLGLVQSKIGRRWLPSAASTAGRPVLEAIVSFRISASGEIQEPTIFQGSGLSVYDREALRAVVEANPLPAPPARFRTGGLNIQFSFTYHR